MPTHGAPKSQIQDESQTKGIDDPKQWLGICQKEAKARGVHKRMGRLLSPCQHETTAHGNGQVAKRRRLRMCIWKSWKRVEDENCQLVKCGIDKYQAYMWGNSRLGYWRVADSPILKWLSAMIVFVRQGMSC